MFQEYSNCTPESSGPCPGIHSSGGLSLRQSLGLSNEEILGEGPGVLATSGEGEGGEGRFPGGIFLDFPALFFFLNGGRDGENPPLGDILSTSLGGVGPEAASSQDKADGALGT